jgi:hypothetical protein
MKRKSCVMFRFQAENVQSESLKGEPLALETASTTDLAILSSHTP